MHMMFKKHRKITLCLLLLLCYQKFLFGRKGPFISPEVDDIALAKKADIASVSMRVRCTCGSDRHGLVSTKVMIMFTRQLLEWLCF